MLGRIGRRYVIDHVKTKNLEQTRFQERSLEESYGLSKFLLGDCSSLPGHQFWLSVGVVGRGSDS